MLRLSGLRGGAWRTSRLWGIEGFFRAFLCPESRLLNFAHPHPRSWMRSGFKENSKSSSANLTSGHCAAA